MLNTKLTKNFSMLKPSNSTYGYENAYLETVINFEKE